MGNVVVKSHGILVGDDVECGGGWNVHDVLTMRVLAMRVLTMRV